MDSNWYIRGGRIIDPFSGRDEIADLCIENGIITDKALMSSRSVREINAEGMVVVPGFIDLHVHFREPGNEEAETVESGSLAAAASGFTTVVAMPNTTPPADTPERIRNVIELGRFSGRVRILPAGCITIKRSGGRLTDLRALAAAGAVAYTDDGSTVASEPLMSEAMTIASELDIPIMDHALDPSLAENAVMRRGSTCSRLGLPGLSSEAEETVVRRDIELSKRTGCAVHIQHVSTKESVELIRKARENGLRVSGEATPHHLSFVDSDVSGNDTNFKMNPPLGTEEDRKAIMAGVVDGTLQALATDHAPHTAKDKSMSFIEAPFGVIGLETAIGATYTLLVESGKMSLMDWARRWTSGPAQLLGLGNLSISPGNRADVAVLDLHSRWTISGREFLSGSSNTPFENQTLTGRAAYTFLGGSMTWNR